LTTTVSNVLIVLGEMLMPSLLTESETASRIRSMRYGFTGGMYPVPDDVPYDGRADWQLTRAAELRCTVLQVRDVPHDPAVRASLKDRAESLDIELEGTARKIFVPLSAEPGSSVDELRAELGAARGLGMTVMRSGWGRLTLETSRFSRERNGAEQMAHMVACLREAGRVAEEVGIRIAVENHCDFTGREIAQVLGDVDSEWVGCALDTANGFTVFCDPNDDIEVLAEFTFTTHMKDMRMDPSPIRGMIPLIPRGCRLGEGHVDFPRALRLLAERSPCATGMHLVVEAGWETYDLGSENASTIRKEILEDGVRYLESLVNIAAG
jgi:3-oxoisoapionate decarboxylase